MVSTPRLASVAASATRAACCDVSAARAANAPDTSSSSPDVRDRASACAATSRTTERTDSTAVDRASAIWAGSSEPPAAGSTVRSPSATRRSASRAPVIGRTMLRVTTIASAQPSPRASRVATPMTVCTVAAAVAESDTAARPRASTDWASFAVATVMR